MRQQRNQLPLNVFTRLWQRWMADQAAQLLEAARLGSDKLEVLTTGQEISNTNRCKVAEKQLDGLLLRRMLAFDLDPYELASSDPALLRHLQRRCTECENRDECAMDLGRTSSNKWLRGQDDLPDYCENALALELLIALQNRPKAPAAKWSEQHEGC
ncbi:MAG TPA: DUF6455 family protein [Xanthobacteraceae bacterium]|jgi:hypothetical protein|nr:DUF6455 family protein [Xanthobacteraceae bacterium]